MGATSSRVRIPLSPPHLANVCYIETVKILAGIVLLAFDAIISAFLIGWGLSGPGFIADGTPEMVPWALVTGFVFFTSLITLLYLGKSNKKAEQLFWYLGIGFPVLLLIPLIVL